MSIAVSTGSSGGNRYGLRNTDETSAVRVSVSKSTAQERALARARARAEQRAREAKKAREAKRAKEAAAKQQIKKKLNYNFKQISRRILQAKTSGSARRAVTSARQKVVDLRKKLRASGYDNQELLIAIRHAEAMARVAKKKLKHLEEEENVKLRGGVCEAEFEEEMEESVEEDWNSEGINTEGEPAFDIEDMQELMEIYQELMEEALEDMESLDDLEDLMLSDAGGEMDPEDFDQMKKKHRSEELRKIMEADMKYLKAMFEKMAKEQQSNSSGIGSGSSDSGGRSSVGYDTGGVSLQLGGVDIPVETQMVDAVELVEGGMIDTSV